MPSAAAHLENRLRLTSLVDTRFGSGLASDVIAGFSRTPRVLPPKHFYDERGAQLFDAICRTPEYYPTRSELGLLQQVAGAVVERARPTHLVEIGSGAARKTRALLDAIGRSEPRPWYMPVDISEEMLVSSARALLADYRSLRVHAVVADYDYHLHLIPAEGRRLIAFLGSTIGNFRQPEAIEFVSAIGAGMTDDDRLLIGFDLVKPHALLHAAYNDAAGITAEFNLNVLRVINRELGADFDIGAFEHDARYLPERQQIEMYLRARTPQTVTVRGLAREYQFAAGEMIRTEISRKFTRSSVETLIAASGLALVGWYVCPGDLFALALASRRA